MPLLVSVDLNRYDAPRNLAYNEACLNRVESGSPMLRIFTFSRPGLILAHGESLWDLRDKFHSLATRRHTGGSVIYVDKDTLGYTLLFHKSDLPGNVVDIYTALTNPLVLGLKERGIDAELGRLFSIRIGGKVIGGHAQYSKKDVVQYDGIVHLKKPSITNIDQTIKLRVLSQNGEGRVICIDGEVYDLKGNHLGEAKDFNLNKIRDEREEISSMPGLSDFGVQPTDYIDLIRSSFQNVFHMEAAESSLDHLREDARKLEQSKYRSTDWIRAGTRRCLGHCFVDLVEPENGS